MNHPDNFRSILLFTRTILSLNTVHATDRDTEHTRHTVIPECGIRKPRGRAVLLNHKLSVQAVGVWGDLNERVEYLPLSLSDHHTHSA